MLSITRLLAASLAVSVVGLFSVTGCSLGAVLGSDGDCEKSCAFSYTCSGQTGDSSVGCALTCSATGAQASKEGCSAEFDASNTCTGGLDVAKCKDATELAKCSTQTQAFAKCHADYCVKNPSDTACGGHS